MKNVRVAYAKTGRMRFVSHLDMNRFMSRVIRRAGLPIWYTEGFNPHPYLTFALPLSLGFESEYELMDIRLTDDDYPLERVTREISKACPEYIRIISSFEPVQKVGKISFASYRIEFDTADAGFKTALTEFLSRESVLCSKTSKRGTVSEFDIIPKIRNRELSCDGLTLLVTLPAGSEDNVNPTLLVDAFFGVYGSRPFYRITRTALLDADGELFK